MLKPEQVKVCISRPDGGVTFMAFVTKSFYPGGEIEFTVEPTKDNIDREIAKANLECSSWRFISDDEIPTDRTFRDAWNDTGTIGVHMPKAREIHKANLRRLRSPLMSSLDVMFMKALETNDTEALKGIAASKQELRDITIHPAIEAAKTPEELSALTI